MADPENFGGGGFKAQNRKNSDVFTKIESDFSAEIGNSNDFFAQNQVFSKKKKKRSSPKLGVIFRPKSEIQTIFSPKIKCSPKKKKKKKKVFTKIGSDFSAGFVTFRLMGGDASRNGAELFEIEADFSAKIVTFRLVGGMHPPPKSATA